MLLRLRQNQIVEMARTEGHVSVQALSTRFSVTLQTIRRDLAELAEAGLLDRVHGGAMPRAGTPLPDGGPNIHQGAKTAIARACAAQIPHNCSVVLNTGTTTQAVARALLDHANLTVLTNNPGAASTLMANPTCQVILTGGPMRRPDGAMLGDLAVQRIRQFKADIAVIGCFAVDGAGDLLETDPAEALVSTAIVEQARQTFLVVDRSKFTRTAPARLASLADLHSVFTDAALPAPLADLCQSAETQVHLAPVQHAST